MLAFTALSNGPPSDNEGGARSGVVNNETTLKAELTTVPFGADAVSLSNGAEPL
jgi:hypothetical protein